MVSVMLICVRNLELTYELHKAIKLNFIDARNDAVVVVSGSKHFRLHAPKRPCCNRYVRAEHYTPTVSSDKISCAQRTTSVC